MIKGRIAEEIFSRMIREDKDRGYTLIPFGYEKILPELAQFQSLVKNYKTLKKIKKFPDFILITKDRTMVYFVEVKYRVNKSEKYLIKDAKKIVRYWPDTWLFVASQDGFYFNQCKKIIENNGIIAQLDEMIISPQIQSKYLNVLKEFIKVETKI